MAVAQIFEAAGNLDQAAAAYERVAQQDPGLFWVRLRILNMRFPVARLQQKYREAKEKSKNGGLELSRQILAADEGYRTLQRLAQEQPRNGDLQYQIGLYRLFVEDYRGAAEALQKATELQPGLAQAWAYLGTSSQYLGRTPEAVAAYKKAVELDPSNIQFRSTYGLLLGVNGEYEAGVAQLTRVTSSPGYKDSAGFTNLGWLYRNMTPKRTKESVAAYKKALELDPKNAQAALGMGWAYSYDKAYDEAIAAFHKAVQIDPGVTSEAMNGAAWCWFFKQDMAQAAAYLDKAQAAGRSDPRLRDNIAKMEKLKEQRAAYEEALRKAQEERDRGPDVGTLSRQAMTGDPASKIRAIRALGDAGREGVPALIRALDDANAGVREAGAEELGGMGPAAKQAVPYLMEMLRAECGKTIMTKEELAESLKCEDAKRKAREAVQKINR
jgi:tetratricopeptide (TPR) repeat protein